MQVLRGIRLCLTGVMAMIPETAGSQELALAISTEMSKKVYERSGARWYLAVLVALLCGGLALWCWTRLGTTTRMMKTRATQTVAKSREEWLEMTIESLRSKCTESGLGTSGTKDMITERLMKFRQMNEALSALHDGV